MTSKACIHTWYAWAACGLKRAQRHKVLSKGSMLLVYYPPKQRYTLVTKNPKIIPRRHPCNRSFFSLHDPFENPFHVNFFQIRTSPSLFQKNQYGVLEIHCEFSCVLSWCTPLLSVILNDVRLNRMKLTTEILKRNF